jgi:2-isopropylmalate synthase
MNRHIEILDSTLRDGAQEREYPFRQRQINILKSLDKFGVDFIEAGNPGSNPKDMDFFRQAQALKLKNAKLCAFGSTCRRDCEPENDANIQALLAAGTEAVSIFGKTWDLHVREILKISLEENLRIVKKSVEYLKNKGKYVIFDAEHFFDGYKADSGYALQVLRAAFESGADTLTLCDTNGGTLPNEIYKVTKEVQAVFPEAKLSIHCHNDTRLRRCELYRRGGGGCVPGAGNLHRHR